MSPARARSLRPARYQDMVADMARHQRILIGIDMGTGGVRGVAVDPAGRVLARRTAPLERAAQASDATTHEQAPAAWWDALRRAATALVGDLADAGIPDDAIAALAVDGTSGTLVCLDRAGHPLRPAIMYNDPRAEDQARRLNDLAGDFCDKLGYRFAASYALAKALWVAEAEPDIFQRTAHLVHHADYAIGRLTGEVGVTDYSNALKTGYDLVAECWPAWLDGLPGVADRLPRVVPPGTPVGQVTPQAARQTGLPAGLTVATGASDGTAACLASGLRNVGDYNTTIGTTLVWKGLSRRLCTHPDGLIYSHKLPGGLWLPGAAGNTGAQWIESLFAARGARELDRLAADKLPIDLLAYPLACKGERFPFLDPDAEGFCTPTPPDRVSHYAACLQGTAFVERLAYEALDDATGASGGEVYCTGGGSNSDVWMRCRADATGRVMHRPACPESAFGSAILAAAASVHADLPDAIARMVRIDRTFEPDPARTDRYDELFGWFCAEMQRRGYR